MISHGIKHRPLQIFPYLSFFIFFIKKTCLCMLNLIRRFFLMSWKSSYLRTLRYRVLKDLSDFLVISFIDDFPVDMSILGGFPAMFDDTRGYLQVRCSQPGLERRFVCFGQLHLSREVSRPGRVDGWGKFIMDLLSHGQPATSIFFLASWKVANE